MEIKMEPVNFATLKKTGILSLICLTLSPMAMASYYRTMVNGAPLLSQTITRQHIENGYDILDKNMNVTQKVPPFSVTQSEKNQQLLQAQVAQQQEERKLINMYGTASRAKMRKDLALNDIKSRLAMARQSQENLSIAYKQTIAAAAVYERTGKAVPATLKKKIDDLNSQIKANQEMISAQENRYREKQQEYDGIIARLTAIETRINQKQ